MAERWRVGRTLGRTVYRMVGEEASKDDECVGMLDSRELASQAVAAVNAITRIEEWVSGDVVTAKSSFGDGYREALRDISDILRGSRG